MKRILAFSFLLLIAVFSLAPAEVPASAPAEVPGADQSPLAMTIEEAVNLALENNYSYRISQEEVKQYRSRVWQNLGFLPTLSVSGYKNLKEKLQTFEFPSMVPGEPGQKITIDFTKNYEFTFQLVQPVFTGGKIAHAFRNAQLDLELAKERERNARADTVLQVKRSFYGILVLRELLQAQQEAQQLAENNLATVRVRYDQGMASQYDLLRAELAVSLIKPELLKVENQLRLSILGLKNMLLIPENREIEIKGELGLTNFSSQLDSLVQSSLNLRSEIKQLRLEQKKTNNLLKMTFAQFLPDFSIVASTSYRSDLFKFTHKNWENYYTINLAVSFPIFTGMKRSAQVGEMYVLRRILDLNLKQLKEGTRLEVESKLFTIQQEYESIQMGMKNMESAREGVRIAELSYQEGMITILELNSSYNELTRAKVAYLQALYNHNIAIAELEKITGINLNGGIS